MDILYRAVVDAALARYRLVNSSFALPPVARPAGVRRIVFLAQPSVVDVEAHPIKGQVPAGGSAFAAGGTL